jgi:hypothetical protein
MSQSAKPALHPVMTHDPPLHALVACASEQACPQPPQLFGSVARLTHAPLQFTSPVWHDTWQLPPEQTSPAAHLVVHAPQLFGSLCVAVQTPKQSVCPDGHWHAPPMHVWPLAQAFPHPPQLPGSLFVLTHAPLHDVWPDGHAHAPPAHAWPEGQALPHLPQLFGSVCSLTQAPPQLA